MVTKIYFSLCNQLNSTCKLKLKFIYNDDPYSFITAKMWYTQYTRKSFNTIFLLRANRYTTDIHIEGFDKILNYTFIYCGIHYIDIPPYSAVKIFT